MKTALKLLVTGAVFVVATVAAASSAQAASLLKSASVTPSDTRPGLASNHAFSFSVSSATAIEEIYISYCTTASGVCSAGGQDVSGATLTGQGGTMDGTWTLHSKTGADAVVLRHPSGDETVAANEPISFTLSGLTNHALNTCNQSSNASSDTCYVRISTYADVGQSTLVDTTTATVTVVQETVVSATVDPTFTFVVGGVNTGVVNNQITTSVSSTYSSLPFGNLTASTPKYAAQSLTVTTNTQSGYTVTAEMRQQMTGIYSGNNIDPYAAASAAWGAPTAWTEPLGTSASIDTAWIGANTTDTDVSGWNSSPQGKFGPVSGTANTVSQSSTSDPGNAVYVTYVIEANVYQPADQYTGNVQYTAVPTY